jgi:hypothetical protein
MIVTPLRYALLTGLVSARALRQATGLSRFAITAWKHGHARPQPWAVPAIRTAFQQAGLDIDYNGVYEPTVDLDADPGL